MTEDSVQFILGLLKDALKGSDFKEFYDGDPDLIPSFNLPCIVVEQTGETTQLASTAEQEVTETIVIKVILNKKDDWSTNVDPLNMTHRKIRNHIGARDATTKNYLPATIRGALSDEIWGNRRLGRDSTVELGIQPRPDETGGELITAEGHVTIQLTHSVYV